MRLGFSLLMLVVLFVDPSEPPALLPVIRATVLAYVAFASLAYALTRRHSRVAGAFAQAYAVDAGAFIVLISLAGVSASAFSYLTTILFLFAVMTASLDQGSRTGLRLTTATAAVFAGAMLCRALILPGLDTVRVLLRLGYILGLGTMMAQWGGHHLKLERRLIMLREAGVLSNPRFGIDHTAALLLGRLRAFHDANVCLLVTKSDDERGWRVRRCEQRAPNDAIHEEILAADLEDTLLWLPRDALAVYVAEQPRLWWRTPARFWSEVRRTDGQFANHPASYRPAAIEFLLTRFGGRSWLSVPVYARQRWFGRLHMTAGRGFDPSDAEFVFHAIENGMLAMENIRLVDQLASTAAERERHRLARDIHDSVIQPYIGLQLGLSAVQRTLGSGNAVVARDEVSRLLELTDRAIDDLRAGVGGLKSESLPHGNGLLPALRRFTAQFEVDTGIAVEITGAEAVRHGDRLAAELFQIAVEGLSNIRRHTVATHAAIRFLADEGHITLQIENQEPSDVGPTAFTPRSISDRVAALGGRVTVDRRRDGRTIVEIRIPL